MRQERGNKWLQLISPFGGLNQIFYHVLTGAGWQRQKSVAYGLENAGKAVLALGAVDFKCHKDVMGYFNKEYAASGVFSCEAVRCLEALKQLREKSDYDDFILHRKCRLRSSIVRQK